MRETWTNDYYSNFYCRYYFQPSALHSVVCLEIKLNDDHKEMFSSIRQMEEKNIDGCEKVQEKLSLVYRRLSVLIRNPWGGIEWYI